MKENTLNKTNQDEECTGGSLDKNDKASVDSSHDLSTKVSVKPHLKPMSMTFDYNYNICLKTDTNSIKSHVKNKNTSQSQETTDLFQNYA